MSEQQSKKTKNVVEVVGIVKENKMEVDKDKVGGSLVIQYGDKPEQQAEVKIYVASKKQDGEHNKKYDTFKELSETLVSVAKATEEKPVSTVRIYGKGDFTPVIRLNEYCPENGNEIISRPELSLGFGNIYVGDIPKEQFKATFDMTVYLLKSPQMEKVNGEETNRLLVNGLFIEHDGKVKPIEFVVEDKELIENISSCKKGETVEFWGSCRIAYIEEVKETKSGFGGKAKTDTKVITYRELVIEGGQPIDEDSKEAIESDFVKKGLVERETFLEELKNKGNSSPTQNKGKGGFGGGNTTKPDIPF